MPRNEHIVDNVPLHISDQLLWSYPFPSCQAHVLQSRQLVHTKKVTIRYGQLPQDLLLVYLDWYRHQGSPHRSSSVQSLPGRETRLHCEREASWKVSSSSKQNHHWVIVHNNPQITQNQILPEGSKVEGPCTGWHMSTRGCMACPLNPQLCLPKVTTPSWKGKTGYCACQRCLQSVVTKGCREGQC
jgi:hypothetical protein